MAIYKNREVHIIRPLQEEDDERFVIGWTEGTQPNTETVPLSQLELNDEEYKMFQDREKNRTEAREERINNRREQRRIEREQEKIMNDPNKTEEQKRKEQEALREREAQAGSKPTDQVVKTQPKTNK